MKRMNALNRRSILSVIIIVSALLLFTSQVYARTFSNIVAFGDSLTDYGNLKQLLPQAQTVYSNGDVWVQYLAQDWNAKLDNKAIAGAMTEGNVDISGPYGLVGEINSYVSSSPQFDPYNTLFSVWIGGNDVLYFLATDPNPAADANAMITKSMANITDGLNALAGAGVTHLLVMNLPNIGKTPRFVDTQFGNTAESTFVTQLSEEYNLALKATIVSFEKNHTSVKVYFFDVFNYMDKIIASGTFKNTTDTYLSLNNDGSYIYNTDGSLAHNSPASDYMFWDSIHPMTRTHELLGNKVAAYVEGGQSGGTCFISTASESAPLPSGAIPLVLLIIGLGLPFVILRIRKQS